MKLLVFVVLVVTSNAKKTLNDDIIKSDGDFEFVRGFVNEVRFQIVKMTTHYTNICKRKRTFRN